MLELNTLTTDGRKCHFVSACFDVFRKNFGPFLVSDVINWDENIQEFWRPKTTCVSRLGCVWKLLLWFYRTLLRAHWVTSFHSVGYGINQNRCINRLISNRAWRNAWICAALESRRCKKFRREIEKLVASDSGYAETRFPEFRRNVKLDLWLKLDKWNFTIRFTGNI